MHDLLSEMKPSPITHKDKENLRLLLETLGQRILRASSILIIGSKHPEYDWGRIMSVAKFLRRKTQKPVPLLEAEVIEGFTAGEIGELIESHDFIISFGVRNTEHKAACLLLECHRSGAYTLGVGRSYRTKYTNVEFFVKSKKLPGVFRLIALEIKLIQERKNGSK